MEKTLMQEIYFYLANSFRSVFGAVNIKSTVAGLILIITEIIGQNRLAYEVLGILVTVDLLTGLMKGRKSHGISSKELFRGNAFKLIVYFFLLLSAYQLVRLESVFIYFQNYVVIYLASCEMLSIIENAHELGVPMPKWIVENLTVYIKSGKLKEPPTKKRHHK